MIPGGVSRKRKSLWQRPTPATLMSTSSRSGTGTSISRNSGGSPHATSWYAVMVFGSDMRRPSWEEVAPLAQRLGVHERAGKLDRVVGRAQPCDGGSGHLGGRAAEPLRELLVARLVVRGEAGVDVERDDALRRELHVQLAGDTQERGFRRAVSEPPSTSARRPRRALVGGGRRHVDHTT